MRYLGSKNRFAKEMLPIILENRQEGQCYAEPFVGGANMIDKVSKNFGWRIRGEYGRVALTVAMKVNRANGGTEFRDLNRPYTETANPKLCYYRIVPQIFQHEVV